MFPRQYCIFCNNTSHFTHSCYRTRDRICYECGKTGHYAKECREMRARAVQAVVLEDLEQPDVTFRAGHCPKASAKGFVSVGGFAMCERSDVPSSSRKRPAASVSPQPQPSRVVESSGAVVSNSSTHISTQIFSPMIVSGLTSGQYSPAGTLCSLAA